MRERVGLDGSFIRKDSRVGLSQAPPDWERHRLGGSNRTRVALAIRDLALQQEVLDYLERDPRMSVVGTVTQPDGLFRLANTAKPDATVACPSIARAVQHPAANGRTPNLLVVAEEMTVPVLREAIEAGARAVFAWPEERDELARTIAAVLGERGEGPSGMGKVIAVFGPRGGGGTTFLACHLAAALADRGRRCVLVDLDGNFADVTVALGLEEAKDLRTAADLLPVVDELSKEHVEDALYRHPRGFSALLAAPAPAAMASLPELYAAAVRQLAFSQDAVILHVPRSLEELARVGLSLADEVVLVLSPDAFSLHAARRAILAFGLADPSGRCRVVINPARRGIGAAEVEGALGIRPSGAIRFDPAVGRAQERGELLPARARRAGRDIRALAQELMVNGPGRDEGSGTRNAD